MPTTSWYNLTTLGKWLHYSQLQQDHLDQYALKSLFVTKRLQSSLDRLLTRTAPGGGVERFLYTARGLVAYTNQLSKVWRYEYDAASRKTAETNANLEVIRYTYNTAGDLRTLTDGKNQVTTWNYDLYGRVTNKLDQANVPILRYQYEADHRLTNRWSAAKGNTAYSYNNIGNLTLVNYPSSPDITMQYDALGRVTNRVDAVGTTKYTYHANGQLLTEDPPSPGRLASARRATRGRATP